MTALGTAARALGARLGRVRPDRVPAALRPWVIVCWLLTLAIAALVLVPGATDGVVARVGSADPGGPVIAPLGIRLLLIAATGVLVGALVVVLRLREAHRLAEEVVLAAALGLPVLVLLADRMLVLAVIALMVAVLAELAAHRAGAGTLGAAITGVLVVAVWALPAVAQFGADAASGWVWIALLGAGAAIAAFGGYYGVARAAESRAAWLAPLFREQVPGLAVAGIVAIVVALTVLRLTVARHLFPDPDPALWTPLAAAPASWVHAVVVAALVVVVAARSVRVPLRRSQERRITAALAVAGNAQLAAGLVAILVGLLIAVATGERVVPGIPPLVVAALKVAGVIVVTAAALLPPFRGTAARALAVISGAYLIPLTVQGLLRVPELGLAGAPTGFAATPVQIALLLLATAVVAGAIAPLRRILGAPLVVRFAVVPFVAVHAGWLLPAAWSELGRIVLVVGVVLALLLLRPEPAADGDRHGRDLLAASAGQLLALVVFLLALPSFLDDPQIVVLGLFWLSVAVIAALTVRTTGDEPAAG